MIKFSLTTLRLWLLYASPALLFFSYHPLISLGSSDSMQFELSLPLIWLCLYDLLFLVDLARLALKKGLRRPTRGLSDLTFFLLSLFPIYATLSMLWSSNPTRAVFTAGLLWAVFIATFGSYQLITSNVVKITTIRQALLRTLYASAFVVSIFCWLQCVLDLAGVARAETLLCAGCTYRSFGFPHPSGFAIEPQFMGNLLLAPVILLLIELLTKPIKPLRKLLFFFLTATLFLTFSRGAIYSFAVALVIIITTLIIKKRSPRPLLVLPLIASALVFTLIAQGLMAQLSPTTDTFRSGIAKSIHQLSLGKIDLREGIVNQQSAELSSENPNPEPVENPVENSQTTPVNSSGTSSFDGYVSASTDIRISLNSYALSTWASSPEYVFTGVGLGGAGVAMFDHFPELGSPREIVQNEYFSLLLETGLAGLALISLALLIIVKRASRAPHRLAFFSLGAAYAVSLLFFSGLPNALHIYLLLPLLIML